MLGRVLSVAVYLGAAIAWLGAMALSSLLGCEGGCVGDESDRLNLSLILAGIGVVLAAAAFMSSLASRRVGLTLLGLHVVVFAVNLVVLAGIPDITTPAIFVVPAAVAAAAGFVAVGGVHHTPRHDQGS